MDSLIRFAVLVSLSFLIAIVGRIFIFSEDLMITSLADKLSIQQVQLFIDRQREFVWVVFVLIPVVHFVKILFAAICLSVGIFAYNLKSTFSDLFKVSISAEFVTLIHPASKILWFSFFDTTFSLTDIKNFEPLSLVYLFQDDEVELWEKTILSAVSLDCLLYFILLIWGLRKVIESDFRNSAKIVFSSYGSGFLIWLLFRVYLVSLS